MKFKDYKYERPNYDEVSEKIKSIAENIKESNDLTQIKNLIDEYNVLKGSYDTNCTIASIRNSLDTNDKYYEDEQEIYAEKAPNVDNSVNILIKSLVSHKLRKELEEYYGSHWFKTMEISLKAFDEKIMDDLVLENKLCLKYTKLLASCKIEFDGKVNNLSQMIKYTNSLDREIRKQAFVLINEFLDTNSEELDNIYDELVKVRTTMAKKMGYKNYIPLGYARMGRTDYNEQMVDNYRKQVVSDLVPLDQEIIQRQGQRIGIENPKFYDLALKFKDGNPSPIGTTSELVDKALKMYSEMSSETKEFFLFMKEHDLMDLESKAGKAGGGYCTYIFDYKSPYIFANFNGTSGDVDVLTHEAGHAFMAYCASKEVKNPDLLWPTSEACEIHSMSMELFAYPWMESFFGSKASDYALSHTEDALIFIPYGVCVDHFQHLVYENYDATKEERLEMWKKLEKMYTPWRDMDGLSSFSKGGFWYRQQHIFTSPFYYIDYTLAQVCALEFYLNSLENKEKSWNQYIKLCKMGGTKSFLELIKEVNISNPFDDGCLKGISDRIKDVIKL